MNRRNPIDWFFKRKLQYYSVDAPMDLWDRIDAQREQQKQIIAAGRKRLGVFLLLLFATAAGLSYLFLLTGEKEENVPNSTPRMIQPVAESPEDPASNIEAEAPVMAAALPTWKQQPARLPARDLLVDAQPKAVPAMPAATAVKNAGLKVKTEPAKEELALAGLTRLPSAQHTVKRKNPFTDGVKCAEFKPEEKGAWSLDVLASPDWSFRTLTPRKSDYADHVESRLATESPDFNYSAGVRVSYVHPSGFLGRIGLNYSQINEKFESRTESEEIITIRNILGPQGDVIGTDTLIETSIHRSFTNNRFESIDIPVIFGYEKTFRKLSVSATAGLLFNVSFQSKGDFLSPMDGEPVSFDDSTPGSFPAFRKNLGIGLYAGASLAYPINANLQFIVEPHLKTYPKTITRDQYQVNQKYLLTGLSVGVRHRM